MHELLCSQKLIRLDDAVFVVKLGPREAALVPELRYPDRGCLITAHFKDPPGAASGAGARQIRATHLNPTHDADCSARFAQG
ncbi:MAG: hypothetical protein AAGG56_07730 [Pseudomonadota bacterium]